MSAAGFPLTCGAGPYRWAVCLCHPQADQARAREGYLHLRRRGTPANSSSHERHLRGAQVSWLILASLLRL